VNQGMVKVAIRYLIDERPDVAVEAEHPNNFIEDQLDFLMDSFTWMVKIGRGLRARTHGKKKGAH